MINLIWSILNGILVLFLSFIYLIIGFIVIGKRIIELYVEALTKPLMKKSVSGNLHWVSNCSMV